MLLRSNPVRHHVIAEAGQGKRRPVRCQVPHDAEDERREARRDRSRKHRVLYILHLKPCRFRRFRIRKQVHFSAPVNFDCRLYGFFCRATHATKAIRPRAPKARPPSTRGSTPEAEEDTEVRIEERSRPEPSPLAHH